MRTLLILPLFTLWLARSQAQTPTTHDSSYRAQVAAFIRWFRAFDGAADTITIEDKVATDMHHMDIHDCLKDLVNFTAADRAELRELIDVKPFTRWPVELTGPAHIIPIDTIYRIFSNGTNGWDDFHRRYGEKFYQIGAPIFLRNNSLCIIYISYSCDWLCGHGFIGLFKKVGNKWEFVRNYGAWIS
jgi:hypothetical protein